jgi:hypothetical protein
MKNIDDNKISRIEIINHASNDYPIGRLITLHKSLGDFDIAEISIQDGGRTMKIFLNSVAKENGNQENQ